MPEPETQRHRCGICGEMVTPDSVRVLAACAHHAPGGPERWNTPFRIRPARPEQDDDIRRIAIGLWGSDVVAAFDHSYPILEQENLVADAGGAVAGFASCRLDGEDGLLVALAVPPVFQGLGVGGSLLSAATRRMAEAGARRVRLTTTNDNLPALQLFQRRGFVVDEVRPGAVARMLEERSGPTPTGFAGIPVRDEFRLSRPIR